MIAVLLALLAHERLGSEAYGVYEVGSGGKRDATNVFENATVGLNVVGADHLTEFGGTVIEVLNEKLGLLRWRGRLVYLEQSVPLQNIVETIVRDLKVSADRVSPDHVAELGDLIAPFVFNGPGQRDNAALACRIFESLYLRGLTMHDVARAGGCVRRPPGRFERRCVGNHTLLLDGAHNPPAIDGLFRCLAMDPFWAGSSGIVAFSKEKDWQSMLRIIAASGVFSSLVVTEALRPRAVPRRELAEFALQLGLRVESSRNLATALRMTLGASADRPIVICGSLLLLADLDRSLQHLGLGEWAAAADQIDPIQPWMSDLV